MSAPLVLLSLLAAMVAPQATDEGDDADRVRAAYARVDRFSSPDLNRLVTRTQIEPHWIDEHRFWHRVEDDHGKRFLLVDAEAGTQSPLFDHEGVAAALSAVVGRHYDPARLPFSTVFFRREDRSVAYVDAAGTSWKIPVGTGECVEVDPRDTPFGSGSQAWEHPPVRWSWRPRLPTFSSRLVTQVDGGYEVDGDDGEEWFLRPDMDAMADEPEDVETLWERISWSPDGRHLASARTIRSPRRMMPVITSVPDGVRGARPEVDEHHYLLPGDATDVHHVWIGDLESGEIVPADVEPIDWWGPPEPTWWREGDAFLVRHLERGFQRHRVIEVDVATGASRTLIEERTDTFLPPDKTILIPLYDTRELIWASERSGWNHLYLVDAETGATRAITSGEYAVRDVLYLDDERREIVFRAGGRDGDDPYLLHAYRTSLDAGAADGNGGDVVRLTAGDGTHSLSWSPQRDWILDTWSRIDHAPVTELRRASDGAFVLELSRADPTDLLATGWRWPERFVAPGRDGATPIHGVIYTPSTFDPSLSYPVVEHVYAGPHASFVPRAFAPVLGPKALAELGFIVVQSDGMGTSHRDKAFQDVAHQNLVDGGFPDRIAWLRAAAAERPWMDLERVGIYGISAGGYNAARALIDHADVYDVAVALAGNHDHRTDKTWWNELWMGWPVGPHYAAQSNVEDAARLDGDLLLIHGEIDHNVNPFAGTLPLVDALIHHNRPFDMLLVPGAGHDLLPHPYVKRRMWDHFTRHLLGAEPPRGYRPAGDPDAGSDIHVTLRNGLDVSVEVSWVDGNGQPRRYHNLAPGEMVTQHTYVGHVWQAATDGEVVGTWTASSREPRWVISRDE